MSAANKPTASPDLIEAAKSGDRLETLIALRDLLAERLQTTGSSRDISSMSRRLMQCISEIETLTELKRQREENPFRLSDFRKRVMADKRAIDKQYSLNRIETEHEAY